MSDDMIFSVHDAVVSNLDRLSKEYSAISEQRLLELYDVALPMAEASVGLLDEGFGAYEVLSVVSDALSLGGYPYSEHNTDGARELVGRSLASLALTDRVHLTELYVKALTELGHGMTEQSFLSSVHGRETFAYVRNSFSDEAYDVFSQDFADPTVRYFKTFRECARAVTTGDVTYCLLPLEEKGGVRLHTVSEIIFRNDFKINSVTPVFGQDGNADMKYALISRGFTVPERNEDDDFYLEIRVGADSPISEVLSVVDSFGMGVYRINTVTFDTEGESETYFNVVIKDGGTSFAAILTYFALFLRDFVPVGIYKNLE